MQGSLSEFLVIALYGFFGVYLPHRIFKAMSPQSAVKLRLGMARDKIAGSAKTDPSFPRGARIAQGMDGGAAHESICRGEKQKKKGHNRLRMTVSQRKQSLLILERIRFEKTLHTQNFVYAARHGVRRM